MAIKKKTESKTESKEMEVKVTRAHEFKSGDISFDCVISDIKLYGLVYKVENPEHNISKPFISFPSNKGQGGKYYNHYWFSITNTMLKSIEDQIGELI